MVGPGRLAKAFEEAHVSAEARAVDAQLRRIGEADQILIDLVTNSATGGVGDKAFAKGEYKHVEGKRILEPVKGHLADTLPVAIRTRDALMVCDGSPCTSTTPGFWCFR